VLVTFSVTEAIEKEVDALEARGVRFDGPVKDDDPVKLAYFADPDGNVLCLCESR
jgi:catechol 2,3-dioxygenase-like lactoylglutathione lyase family enzyme